MRTETDLLGSIQLPDDCYYGIATARAIANFNVSNDAVHPAIIHELVNIKKQAAIVNRSLGYLNEDKATAIITACDRILAGEFANMFVVNRHQGGAGTSTNMNVNEVVANVALEQLRRPLGDYDTIHPINDVNRHQSTNDTYPTAVRIAAIKRIRRLADAYASLQQAFQAKEREYGHVLKLSRTELMDAVPMLAGQMFGAWASVTSRDRWRIYKVEERMRVMNIGGTAVGTGLNAPVKYTFMMTSHLQQSTNIGLSRAENLIDATQNLDAIVETSGLLKVAAVSLHKIANDLRYLASGPNGGIGEIILEDHQAGSSIMPGKVNPVILEMTVQAAQRVIANDVLITNLAAAGNLELNAFLPEIAEALLESLELLERTVIAFTNKVVKTLVVNEQRCLENLEKSHALITPLITLIGYDRASAIVKRAHAEGRTIKDVLLDEDLFTNEQLDELLNPYNITKPGIIEE